MSLSKHFTGNNDVLIARMQAQVKDRQERKERAEERAVHNLRMDMTSLGQQFTGISVICTFIATVGVALLSLANDMTIGDVDRAPRWARGIIYLMWYLALVYSLSTAIASGASAVFSFSRANGRLDDEEARSRVTADRERMGQLVVGYGVCFATAVTLLFVGLVFFVLTAPELWIIAVVGITVLPLWGWLLWQAYKEVRAMRGSNPGERWGGLRLLGVIQCRKEEPEEEMQGLEAV